MTGTQKGFRFEVAFSFAGPHRDKVKGIAEIVAARLGFEKVFFDEWYEHEILGDDMDVLLQRIYHEQSLMVVADLSDEYAERPWTQAEARAIRALRMSIDTARDEIARLRLLNAKFGDGRVPGVLPNAGYLDATKRTVEQCAELILGRHALLVERMAGEIAPALAQASGAPVLPIPPTYNLTPEKVLFFHPATNDSLYSHRERELDWLDNCAKDARIRIATVTGIGGLGKTSLIGHWIDVSKGWQHRGFRGVFFYSFYSDRDPQHFFEALIDFAYKSLGQDGSSKEPVLHHAAATLAERWPFLIVLDGLEVLQADVEDSHYGWINDSEINEFVSRLGERGPSLLLLTSRFPFPGVVSQFPEHARPLQLEMFSPEEGADLLEKCGLPEDREARMAFSEQFGGHPLALRLFAGASMAAPATPPSELSREVLRAEKVSTLPDPKERGIAADERQRRRQRRQFQKLLEWLQAKLPAPKRRLLQLVALFREPVPTATLTALATGLDAIKADFLDCDSARIRSMLDALVREHLLQREDAPGSNTASWAAHPIVREVFRAEALKAGDTVAAQFAQIVAGRGRGDVPTSAAELQPILGAIEVLLAAGNFEAANRLYRGRLKDGRVFKSIPSPQDGLRCAHGFVESTERRDILERVLGREELAFLINEVALWKTYLGEIEGVEQGYEEANELYYKDKEWDELSIGFQNIAVVQGLRGALREATGIASEALFYAGVKDAPMAFSVAYRLRTRPARGPYLHSRNEINARAIRAHALSLAGELRSASRDFAVADTAERNLDSDPLHSLNGIRWCRHRLRLGDRVGAHSLTMANKAICELYNWNAELALCYLLLGELHFEASDLDSTAWRVSVGFFRGARLGIYLPEALLNQARLRRSVDDCEEGLRLAARSGFGPVQCDALNLRALFRCKSGDAHKAAEDAHGALEIAERCRYYWGRHEALRQLRHAAKASGRRADERHWDEAEKELSNHMQPSIKEALEIEHAHDREMEEIYGKVNSKNYGRPLFALGERRITFPPRPESKPSADS
jgi:hypothetical protein